MSNSITALAAAMHSDADALRVISQNIANAGSPAYRREIALARLDFDSVHGVLSMPTAQSSVDVRPGTLQATGEPLSLAIEGKGFFVVGTTQGERLTRRGDFRLDNEGRLVTYAGDAVLGTNGPITLSGATPSIETDGTIRIGETVVDRLRLAEVGNDASLIPTGDSLYALTQSEQAIETGASQVRQGFIETSNVSSSNEMIQLIETMRRFEAAQRFVRGYDAMVDSAITTLGKI